MNCTEEQKRTNGFTLIELLVVISIVALLMAILMPALQHAKKQARSVACQSNLHQWAIIFSMYTDDNDGKFYKCWTTGIEGHRWIECVKPYYTDPKICFCPTATKPASTAAQGVTGSKFIAWGVFSADDHRIGYPGSSGSYGINDWVGDPIKGVSHGEASWYWWVPSAKGANQAPLFLDSKWLGGFPIHNDSPPAYDDGRGDGQMDRCCINRHDGSVNTLMVDFSIRKVGLKELWKLKWHRQFDTNGPWTTAGECLPSDWPEWMRYFKNY